MGGGERTIMSLERSSFNSRTLSVIDTSRSSVVCNRTMVKYISGISEPGEDGSTHLLVHVLPQVQTLLVSDLNVREMELVDKDLNTLGFAW